MMDATSDDPIEMIAALARGMVAERRGRFLDAACGDDANLRVKVDARLGVASANKRAVDRPVEALVAQVVDPERDSIESIALEALLEVLIPHESHRADSRTDLPENLSIDDYCNVKQLGIFDRLRLFQQVCRVIDQDHRRGLIHGGLTLKHIRIFPDGSLQVIPREPSSQPAEVCTNLEYASPEQVLGEHVTTATDVYQLGVLLYELITGRGPYRLRSRDPDEICNAISEQSPERPSLALTRNDTQVGLAANIAAARRTSSATLQRQLAGDLDLIMLHALHKEPERRYATAEQFAEDIDDFLQLRPVRAHRESRFYRAGKFIRRHPVAIALALLMTTGMAAGVVSSAISLSRVRHQRDHAATSFLIAHNAVDELFTRINEQCQVEATGLQAARVTLLDTLLRYYENLLELDANDLSARALAAEAQHRIARVDLLIGRPHVAAWQLQRTIDRYDELAAHDPGDVRYQDDLASILNELGELLLSINGRGTEAFPFLERAQSLLEVRIASGAKAATQLHELAGVLGNIAEVEREANHPDRAQMNLTRAIGVLDGLIAANPQSLDDRIALATKQIALGRILSANPDSIDQAVLAFAKGIDLRRAITREHPDRFDQVHELALDLGERAAIEQKTGRLEVAIQAENQALELFEALDRRFPDMVSYQTGLYVAYDMESQLYSQQGETKLALKLASQTRTVLERLVDQNPRELSFQLHLSRCHSFIGRLLCRSQRFTEALRSFQRAVDLLESLPQLDPASSYQLAANLGLCVSLIGAGPGTAPPDDEAELNPTDRLRRQIYGTRAVVALNHAVAGGFASLQICQSDADLDSLRDRPDFQKLLKEVAEIDKAKP